MSQITPFNFNEQPVRVLTIAGEPWFVLNDLCKVLDLSNPRNVSARLADDMKGVRPVDTLGGTQNLTIVNEPGMYEVIIRSDKPEAAAFRRWITSEVLPAIRQHGGYLTPEATEAALTDPDFIIRLATSLKEERAARELAQAKAVELDRELTAAAPKAAYVDAYVTDDDIRLVRNVAKDCGISEATLRTALLDHGWIYAETASRWSLKNGGKVETVRYSPFADKRNYFRMVPNHEAPRFKGEVMHTLKVTPEGAVAIHRAVRRWGLVADANEGER